MQDQNEFGKLTDISSIEPYSELQIQGIHKPSYKIPSHRITRVVKQNPLNKWVQNLTKHLTSMEKKSNGVSSHKVILNKYFIKTRNWSNPRFSQYSNLSLLNTSDGLNKDLKQVEVQPQKLNANKNHSYCLNSVSVLLAFY